eukprot:375241_1
MAQESYEDVSMQSIVRHPTGPTTPPPRPSAQTISSTQTMPISELLGRLSHVSPATLSVQTQQALFALMDTVTKHDPHVFDLDITPAPSPRSRTYGSPSKTTNTMATACSIGTLSPSKTTNTSNKTNKGKKKKRRPRSKKDPKAKTLIVLKSHYDPSAKSHLDATKVLFCNAFQHLVPFKLHVSIQDNSHLSIEETKMNESYFRSISTAVPSAVSSETLTDKAMELPSTNTYSTPNELKQLGSYPNTSPTKHVEFKELEIREIQNIKIENAPENGYYIVALMQTDLVLIGTDSNGDGVIKSLNTNKEIRRIDDMDGNVKAKIIKESKYTAGRRTSSIAFWFLVPATRLLSIRTCHAVQIFYSINAIRKEIENRQTCFPDHAMRKEMPIIVMCGGGHSKQAKKRMNMWLNYYQTATNNYNGAGVCYDSEKVYELQKEGCVLGLMCVVNDLNRDAINQRYGNGARINVWHLDLDKQKRHHIWIMDKIIPFTNPIATKQFDLKPNLGMALYPECQYAFTHGTLWKRVST